MPKSSPQQRKVTKSLTEVKEPDTMGLRIKKQRSHRPTATKTKVSETPNERATRNRERKDRN